MSEELLLMKHTVTVRFKQGTNSWSAPYSYFTTLDLQAGDWVTVMANGDPAIVKVEDPDSLDGKATHWVLRKENLQELKNMDNKYKYIAQVEKELDEELKRVNRAMLFQSLANKSPRMQHLLGKLAELDPVYKNILDAPKETEEPKEQE